MKLAIVYCSQTGHTKRYAEWLADEFGITAIPLKQVDSLTIAEADLVVFCTWYHAAGLAKAAWLQKQLEIYPEEKFVVLGVGATPMPCEEWPESEHEQAFCNSFPKEKYPNLVHFYAQGGFRFDKPVSYTHLDVYKRQGDGCAPLRYWHRRRCKGFPKHLQIIF